MKLNKKVAILTTILVICIATVGTTLAYFSARGEATNVITMGKVDIRLEEPGFSEITDNTNTIEGIVPNQIINKDPTIFIEDDSKDAYIRVKLEYENTLSEEQIAELESNMNIDTDDWVKGYDGYYYYKISKLSASGVDSVVFFDKVVIPEKWKNEIAGKTFSINVSAEAIQADNFTPREVNGVYGWFYSDDSAITIDNYSDPI